MPIYAFKNGYEQLAENFLNQLWSAHDFVTIFEGTEIDAKDDAGVTENSLADYTYAARFTATGVTEVARVELHLDRDGEGADLVVQIRDSDFNPDGSADGTVLKEVTVPKEFVPDPAGWWSVPLDLTDLTAGNEYWLVLLKAGDAINKVDLIGEASQDGSYPVYCRSGSSGAWTASNAVHFRVYSGDTGDPLHCLIPEATVTTVYDGDIPSKTYLYIPPPDGPAGGIRDIMTITMSGNIPKRGAVT